MKVKKFLGNFSEGAKSLLKEPVLIVSGLVLWLVLWGISGLGKLLAPNFQTTWANVAWTVGVGLVSFLLGAYVLAGMVGVLKNKKGGMGSFVKSANSFWVKSFLILVFILVIGFIIGRVAHYGAFYIGKAANLETMEAVVVFVLIYFIGLIGAVVFLTFSNFILILKNLKVHTAIKASAALAKKEYPATISLNVIFFLLFLFVDWIPGIVGEVLLFGLLLPYLVAVLTRFVETADLKKSEK